MGVGKYFKQREIDHFRKYQQIFGKNWDQIFAKALRSFTLTQLFECMDRFPSKDTGISFLDKTRSQFEAAVAGRVTGQQGVNRTSTLDMIRGLVIKYRVHCDEGDCRPEDRAM